MPQHDYVVDNNTGANFRTDLNNALAAIVGLNSGSSAPSTTYAYQIWIDTANNLLKIRDSANTTWITDRNSFATNLGLLALAGGTLTGRLSIKNAATVGSPDLDFASDTTTGIYSPAASMIGLVVAATELLRVDGVAGLVKLFGTKGVQLPTGSTAARPSASAGMLRYNTDNNAFEGNTGSIWSTLGGNNSFNNYGFTTTATAGSTTTLTATSNYVQIFTGSSAQTVALPTTTVGAGLQFLIVNRSSTSITVQSSGANTIQVMASNTSLIVTAVVATPTTAANWDACYDYHTTLPVAAGGTGFVSTNAYGAVFGGTTTTGNLQTVAPGAAGSKLVSLGTSSLPNWSSGVYMVYTGNGGQSITAATTDITFSTQVNDNFSAWNGTQFSAPYSGIYTVTGSILTTTSIINIIDVYVNNTQKYLITPAYATGSHFAFSGNVFLGIGDNLSIRMRTTNCTLSNSAIDHWISICKSG